MSKNENKLEDEFGEKIRTNFFVLPNSHLNVDGIWQFVSKAKSQAVSNREKEIAEEVEKIKTAGHDECNDDFKRNVLKILNHNQ